MEEHALASHAIQVGRPDVSAIGTDGFLVLVVRKKDDDVWPLGEEALRNQEGENRAGDSFCLKEAHCVESLSIAVVPAPTFRHLSAAFVVRAGLQRRERMDECIIAFT